MDKGLCILQMIFDAEDRPIDYRHLEVNRVFEQQLGMAGALGKTVRAITPDIEPFWIDPYGRVALTGLLSLTGHQVRMVHRGLHAIEAERSFRPDAIFLYSSTSGCLTSMVIKWRSSSVPRLTPGTSL